MASTRPSILTDVGTNELEVVEFHLDGRPYAINVAKVREIVRPQAMMPVPESHPCLLGVFRNRDEVIPVVDLGRWLGCQAPVDLQRAKIIVAEFNRMKVGFLVHGVSRIHRVTWADLETPSQGSMVESRSALGFMRLGKGSEEGERIVFLLDFERIVGELRPGGEDDSAGVDRAKSERRRGRVVLIAEDSSLIRKSMKNHLEAAGYTVVVTTNGQEAWGKLEGGLRPDAVVSDIEMPLMDGHHLTRRIKGHPTLRTLPVVLYSSMIYEEMRRKGEAIGADAQICKPDLADLSATVDRFLLA